MTHAGTGKKNAALFLNNRVDYRNESTVIEKLFRQYGHIVIASPRYHPELAGQGIEYCWGKAKYCFRNHANDLNSKHLLRNVLVSLGNKPFKKRGTDEIIGAPLPVDRVRRFARRARTYRTLFELYPTPEAASAAVKAWKSGKHCLTLTNAMGEVFQLGKSSKPDTNFYDMIEKMYKFVKTHCNIIDVDFAVCTRG